MTYDDAPGALAALSTMTFERGLNIAYIEQVVTKDRKRAICYLRLDEKDEYPENIFEGLEETGIQIPGTKRYLKVHSVVHFKI